MLHKLLLVTLGVALCCASTAALRIENGLVYADGETVGRPWIKPSEKAEIMKMLDDQDASLKNMDASFANMPSAHSGIQSGKQGVQKSRADY